MARVIVRYSMQSGAAQRRIRGRLRKSLPDQGFRRIGTATYEASDIDLSDAVLALNFVLEELGSGQLDNLWIYVDQPGEFED